MKLKPLMLAAGALGFVMFASGCGDDDAPFVSTTNAIVLDALQALETAEPYAVDELAFNDTSETSEPLEL